MKTFIGVKVINAEPMNRHAFEKAFRSGQPQPLSEDEEGYHVVYPNPKGEYHSWSPKLVFDQAHRQLTAGETSLIKMS